MVVRAFVQLRQMLASNAELSRKLVTLEKNYDIKFKAIFEAIHQLMVPTDPKKKCPIGFAPWEKNDADPYVSIFRATIGHSMPDSYW